jgi:eukaryotic-like serine/threonine-protein kinase
VNERSPRLELTARDYAAGQKVFSRYTLKKILGRGGMGVVWLARDEELERDVALKFLPDLVVLDKGLVSELKRETRRSLELTHKNIVRIYDFVQGENSACISMEYIDGDTLSNLRAEKEQKVFHPEEIAGWTAQLCDALDYAHNHARIIHRDLKPANLMVNQRGDLKVSDFGIARSLGDSMSKLTMVSGGTSGTLVYMSPQQLDGERGTHLDDVYSLGATIYDLLTSKPPFYSGNIDRQVHERTAPSMTERRKEFNIEPAFVPPHWEQTVAACLAKDPARRPQSTAEVAQRLQVTSPSMHAATVASAPRGRKKAVVLAALALLVGVVRALCFGLANRRPEPQPVATAPADTTVPQKSVAILPFKPLSSQNRDEILEAGMADTLIAKLSTSREIIIPSLTSARKYAEQENDPLAAGRLLRVRAVLEGSLHQTMGDRIRVTARLINVADGASLWSGTFDEKFTDVFAVQDAIAQKVATALAPQLGADEQARLMKRYTDNTEAYKLYLSGRFHWNKFTEDGFRKALDFFKQALEKDPGYALAYAGLADAYSISADLGFAVAGEAFPKARVYAENALKLDDTLSDAHLSLGIVKLLYEADFTGAEMELRRAKELNPNNAQAYHFYAHYLQVTGRVDEGVVELKRGAELDPTSPSIISEFATAYLFARKYEAAIAQYRKALELNPADTSHSAAIALVYGYLGKYQEAFAEFEKVRADAAAHPWTIAIRATLCARAGRRAEAQELLEKVNSQPGDPRWAAWIYTALGDKDQAFAELNKLPEASREDIPWVHLDPAFDPLRSDPRYPELFRRAGFEIPK